MQEYVTPVPQRAPVSDHLHVVVIRLSGQLQSPSPQTAPVDEPQLQTWGTGVGFEVGTGVVPGAGVGVGPEAGGMQQVPPGQIPVPVVISNAPQSKIPA